MSSQGGAELGGRSKTPHPLRPARSGDDGHSHGNRRLHGLSSDGPALWSGLGRALLQNDQVVFDAPLTANLAIDADVSP